jgi:uncharacterized membrane protein YvbJ
MKQCPYCKGEVPDDAMKCKHCGEWVSRPPGLLADPSLGRAANRWVTFNIVWAIVIAALMLTFFFGFFLPRWNSFPNW